METDQEVQRFLGRLLCGISSDVLTSNPFPEIFTRARGGSMKTLVGMSVLVFCMLFTGSATAEIHFTDISAALELPGQISGEGACVFDYDGDGWEDVFIAGFSGRNLLYHNLGNMTFEEVALAAGLDSTGRTRAAVSVDYDGDGFNDLFLGCYSDPSRLFHNNGDGTFTDVTVASGITGTGDSRGATWVDYDGDGMLDLYVTSLLTPNILCRNNGDGTFSEMASTVNAEGPMPDRLVMGVSAFDYDRDGDIDFFMAQDGNRGSVLLQRELNGTYTDVSLAAGVHLPVQGMGVGVGDYNRDGFFDVYTTNLDESTLLRNNGDGTFTDVTVAAGVGDQHSHMGWGVFFFDSDNDGWLDLYINNQTGFGDKPNSFFHNLHDGTFEDLSLPSGLECFNDGIGSACGDLDNDGDVDIVLAGYPSSAGNIKLFRNDSDVGFNWIQITLQASGINHSAIGSLVQVYTGSDIQTSMVSAGGGYASQNSLRLHFGLGLIGAVDSVIVFWPNGSRERFNPGAINERILIVQGTGTTGVDNPDAGVPVSTRLNQNFPNPFNPSTEISFQLAEANFVSLKVYDLLGRELVTLVEERLEAGTHKITFSNEGASGRDGIKLSSGMYFYRLNARTIDGKQKSFVETKRMLLVK